MLAASLLSLAGCEAVQTFSSQTSDLANGGPGQRIAAAQANQDAARQQNISLRDQLANLQAQQEELHGQLAIAQGRLNTIRRKLAHDRQATQAQRDQYQRLIQKQRDLQKRLADAAKAPPADNREDAADQKEELDKLAREKANLEQQVDTLQHAL
jgi:chromosome segregation ATPase